MKIQSVIKSLFPNAIAISPEKWHDTPVQGLTTVIEAQPNTLQLTTVGGHQTYRGQRQFYSPPTHLESKLKPTSSRLETSIKAYLTHREPLIQKAKDELDLFEFYIDTCIHQVNTSRQLLNLAPLSDNEAYEVSQRPRRVSINPQAHLGPVSIQTSGVEESEKYKLLIEGLSKAQVEVLLNTYKGIENETRN